MNITNDLLLKALRGETIERPPVWMMRQAGRYLPDFMKLKERYPFFDRVQNPELAAEITLMPIDQVGVDAAIIFSDILVVPQALGFEVQMVPGTGPYFPNPVTSIKQVEDIELPDPKAALHYVMDAIELTNKEMNFQVPLIGFAGAPWTILCYMVQGQGSKTFDKAKAFCFREPKAAAQLLDKITELSIGYLQAQVEAGASVIQLFDSWGGLLSYEDYHRFSFPYIRQIVESVSGCYKVIFAKGCWFALQDFQATEADALGIDWTVAPKTAREITQGSITLQGNFDPAKLLTTPKQVAAEATKMVEAFGIQRYIANLGHGILPEVPVENAKAFVTAVKTFQYATSQ